MKKTIFFFLLLFFLLMPRFCPAAYLIELTSGLTYLSDYYWEEDGRIKFSYFGGIIGFSKKSIRKITETDQGYINPTPLQKAPSMAKKNSSQPVLTAMNSGEKAGKNIDPEKKKEEKLIDFTIYKNKRNRLLQEYSEAQNTFSQTIQNRDRIAQREAAREISRIERERVKVAKEIREKNNGVLPSWWQQEDEE